MCNTPIWKVAIIDALAWKYILSLDIKGLLGTHAPHLGFPPMPLVELPFFLWRMLFNLFLLMIY
jgi:hypothetical protein